MKKKDQEKEENPYLRRERKQLIVHVLLWGHSLVNNQFILLYILPLYSQHVTPFSHLFLPHIPRNFKISNTYTAGEGMGGE